MSTEIKEGAHTILTQFCGDLDANGDRRNIQITKKNSGKFVKNAYHFDLIRLNKVQARELIDDLSYWLSGTNKPNTSIVATKSTVKATTFKSQLKNLKLGQVVTKSRFYQDVTLKELSGFKQKQNSNITGSINNAGLNGKVETTADYTIMKTGVVICTHILRIK